MSGGIFISYRREDSAGFAGRIYDRLVNRLQREYLFFDVDNLEPGVDFVKILSDRVGDCDALVAIIGRSWLSTHGEDNRRRLDDPLDFVRIEIEAALTRDIRVIPVFVDGATMPRSENLPEPLKPLARRQGIEISHTRFDSDTERLARALGFVEEERRKREAAETERVVREERERQEAAETARKAEEERSRRESAEAERIARQERERQQAAEAASKAEEEQSRREAAKAERVAREDRDRQEAAEAARKAEEERGRRQAAEAERVAREKRENLRLNPSPPEHGEGGPVLPANDVLHGGDPPALNLSAANRPIAKPPESPPSASPPVEFLAAVKRAGGVLADVRPLRGFFSYSRQDDQLSDKALSRLREKIADALKMQLGHDVEVWQDTHDIRGGARWELEIRKAIASSVFFIPIVTPSSVNSTTRQLEWDAFRETERALERTDLVFPIVYVGVSQLRREGTWKNEEQLALIGERQYADFTELRFLPFDDGAVKRFIWEFCGSIVIALGKRVEGAEVEGVAREGRERLEAAEAERISRQAHEKLEAAEAARRAEEERGRREAAVAERIVRVKREKVVLTASDTTRPSETQAFAYYAFFPIILSFLFCVGLGYYVMISSQWPHCPAGALLLLSLAAVAVVYFFVRQTGFALCEASVATGWRRFVWIPLFLLLFVFGGYGFLTSSILLIEGPDIARDDIAALSANFGKLQTAARELTKSPTYDEFSGALDSQRKALMGEIEPPTHSLCGIGPQAAIILNNIKDIEKKYEIPLISPSDVSGVFSCSDASRIATYKQRYSALFDAIDMALRQKLGLIDKKSTQDEILGQIKPVEEALIDQEKALVGVHYFVDIGLYHDVRSVISRAYATYLRASRSQPGFIPDSIGAGDLEHLGLFLYMSELVWTRLFVPLTLLLCLLVLFCHVMITRLVAAVLQRLSRLQDEKRLSAAGGIGGKDVTYLWQPERHSPEPSGRARR